MSYLIVNRCQCVPKKEDMLVVTKKKNELIPTRIVKDEECALTIES